jgi:hypothetical protein
VYRFAEYVYGFIIAYREFVRVAATDHQSAEMDGGGLRRSAGGWQYLPILRRGRERWAHDERILGSSDFVATFLTRAPFPADPRRAADIVRRLSEAVADRFEVSVAQITSPSLARRVLAARAALCHLAISRHGPTPAAVARLLDLSKQGVMRAIDRARQRPSDWPDLDDLAS